MRYLILGREEKSGSNDGDVFLQPDVGGAQRGIRALSFSQWSQALIALLELSNLSPISIFT